MEVKIIQALNGFAIQLIEPGEEIKLLVAPNIAGLTKIVAAAYAEKKEENEVEG